MSNGKNTPGMNNPGYHPTHLLVGRDYKGSDYIGSIGTQNNSRVKHNHYGTGHFINYGRDQNVNNSTGTFSVNSGGRVETISRELERLTDSLRSTFADKATLRTFLQQRGQLAQSWLDRMQQLVDYPNTPSELRSSILKAMLRLSKNSGRYPKCLMIQNVRKLEEYPVDSGRFGDVWKGVIGSSTEPVCLKVIKIYRNSNVEKLSEAYICEAIIWRQMKHPNLLPFLGIYHFEHKRQLCLISPWMEEGNLVQYLESTPRKKVEHHTLACDVASGLHHLHINKIVHGDLKGVNVLITNEGRACLADFGLSRVAHIHGLPLTPSSIHPAGTARWMAPELFKESQTSEKSDIYAYGCVCFEIFTGSFPFPELSDMAVAHNVPQGKRMSRPHDVTELTDDMWAIMESCWDANRDARPSMEGVLSKMKPVNWNGPTVAKDWSDTLSNAIWNNVERQALSEDPNRTNAKILEWARSLDEHQLTCLTREGKAEWSLRDMQRVTYFPECDPSLKNSILKSMISLSKASGCCIEPHYNPNVQKLGKRPLNSNGTFADVWKGRISVGPKIMALKVLKQSYVSKVSEELKTHMRDVIGWRMVDHPNVVPFIGSFYFGKSPREMCLVSPWIGNGNIFEYLQNNNAETLKRFSFAWDVASGLEYLHSMDIVHGNLKGNNVMIARGEVACITDYGVVPVLNSGGDIRPTPWCAREVLVENVLNEKSDVHALGFVCYEIFVGRIPFLDMEENELRKAIAEQKLQVDRPKVNKPLPWEVMQRCWTGDPASRPSATDVRKNLAKMTTSVSEQNSDDTF